MKVNKMTHQISLIGLLIAFLQFCCADSIAQQRYRQSSTFYFGLYGGLGSRTFKLNSNIPELDKIKISEEGFNVGISAGTNAFEGKIRHGFYQSSATMRERLDMVETEIGANLFPMHFLQKKGKFLKPYTIVSLDRSSLKFYGSYELPPAKMGTPPPPPCGDDEGGLPGDPDAPVDPMEKEHPSETTETVQEERFVGRIVVSRFSFGGGMLIHLPQKNNFFNFFAEVKYGLPIGVKAMIIEFQETRVSNQLAVNFGVSFGFKQ